MKQPLPAPRDPGHAAPAAGRGRFWQTNLLATTFLATVLATPAAARAGGAITGTVSYAGSRPSSKPLDRKSDAFCAKTKATDPTVLVGKGGKTLGNVVVRLTNAPKGKAPNEPIEIGQHECMYTPRVQTAVAGQRIVIKNGDATLHNVHAYAGKRTLFNNAQPPSAPALKKKAPSTNGVMTFKCDVHAWMRAYVVVSPHAFAATTGPDGTFEIKDVPPGAYDVEAWHESLGTRKGKATVTEGGKATIDFSFK